MGKDYFVRVIMNHGEAYTATTSTNLNWLGLLRFLPMTVELKKPTRFLASIPGASFGYLREPLECYESYVNDLERHIDKSSSCVERDIKVAPQNIGTLVFCEEVSKLEEKLKEEHINTLVFCEQVSKLEEKRREKQY